MAFPACDVRLKLMHPPLASSVYFRPANPLLRSLPYIKQVTSLHVSDRHAATSDGCFRSEQIVPGLMLGLAAEKVSGSYDGSARGLRMDDDAGCGKRSVRHVVTGSI
jgi:hypothetical protein